VTLQKIKGPEGSAATAFVLTDLDGAPAADGIVRAAKKILVDGATTLARSRTYAWALLGKQVSGASAGINAAPPDQAAGVAAFVEAVSARVRAGELSLDPGKGVSREDLAPLAEADQRSALLHEQRGEGTLADELLATSVVAAASAAVGGLEGRRVAIEGGGEHLPALQAALDTARATVVAIGEEALSTEAEVLLCGSKVGVIDHAVAEQLPHRVVVPHGPVPITAKGLAVATRRSIVVLPDFLTTSGPLHAFRPEGEPSAQDLVARANEHAATLTAELLDHPEGPLLGACYRAEEFLRTWQEQLPFGRPLA
jgi:glutamate dehydrogenase (NAD(P)+)